MVGCTKAFLEEHHPSRYAHLILEGQLWNRLIEIDKHCNARMEVLIAAMKIQEGVTEAIILCLRRSTEDKLSIYNGGNPLNPTIFAIVNQKGGTG